MATTKKDYQATIELTKPPMEVYNAVAKVKEWWSADTKGPAKQNGDRFTVKFGTTFVDFEVTQAVAGRHVSWKVCDCYLPWLKDKTEWKETTVDFSIEETANGSMLTMTHFGITPAAECYEDCKAGWDGYIKSSLASLINTGNGAPYKG